MQIQTINFLRTIAILAVIFHHSIWPQLKPIITPYIFGNFGYMAVSLFFVLSGFVIALPYWNNQRNFSQNTIKKIFHFYFHRFLRLYPLFIITAIIGLIVIGINFHTIKEFFYSLTTVGSLSSNYFMPSINPAYWSLMLEIQMSIIFPFIILFHKKIHIVLQLIIFATIAYFVSYFGYYNPSINPHTTPERDFILWHLDEFVLWIFIAFLYSKSFFISLKKYNIFCILGWIFLLFFWIVLADLGRYWQFFGLYQNIDYYILAFRNIFLSFSWFLLIIWFITFDNQISPKLWYIWKMSFSFYLWHVLILIIFEKFFGTISNFWLILTIFYLIVTIFVSILSFYFIELKFTKTLISKFSPKK